MAITRAQYLQGNSSQGNVLLGQVQGVKQGPGTIIAADGTISIDPSTVAGLVKLNNPAGFNNYVWPSTSGAAAKFLMSDGTGNLSWQSPSVGSTVDVGTSSPTSPQIGQLWFDPNERLLKVYENVDGQASPVWTPVSRGIDPSPESTTSNPAFIGTGDGTSENPFLIRDLSIQPGNFVRSEETITIGGLAPYQYVPITDLNADLNQNRFSASNYFADGEGNLTFRIIFSDFPTSTSGMSYAGDIEVGFSSVIIRSVVSILDPLALQTFGNISGTPKASEVLSYSPGMAVGGKAPYTYSWMWKKASSGDIIQTNGSTLVIPESAVGDRIIVELKATDSNGTSVTGNTAGYPTSPAVVQRGMFPYTTIGFPTSLFQTIATRWLDTSQVLYSNGCIEISVDNANWGQGPYNISNGGTVYTRWIISPSCSGAANGAVLTGCVFSAAYEECGSFTIDRVPSPFSFIPNTNLQLNSTTTSNSITPVGYNATAYVTYSGQSSLTNIQGSLDNGTTWVNIPIAGTNTFAINPGQSLRVRGTVGSEPLRTYMTQINIGWGSSVQTATFNATTTEQTTFTTQIRFPTSTSQGYGSVPGIASDGWSATDGTVTTLYATDCVEIRIENSSGGLISDYTAAYPRTINPTDVIRTRWKTTSGCGGAPQGTTIRGFIHNAATVPTSTRVNTGSLMIDRAPGQFSFTNITGQALSTQVTTETVSLSGFNATTYLTATGTLTGIQASISGGAWTSVPTSGTSFPIEPSAAGHTPPTLRIRGTTGAVTSTDYTAVVRVGDGGASYAETTWTARTTAAVATVTAPSITAPTNGATGINPFSISPAGVNLTSSAYVAINGASATQLNSEWEVRSGSETGTIIYTQTKTSNFTTFTIPLNSGGSQLILPNTTYFVRVRYRSADGTPVVSNWSPFSSFKTATTFTQTWSLRASRASWAFQSDMLASSADTWMAIGINNQSGSTFTYGVVTSSTGTSWATVGSFTGPAFNAVANGNGYWLVVGNGSSRRSANNGVTWETPTNSGLSSSTMWAIAFGAGTFVAVGNNGVIQTTTDGLSWTTRASGTTGNISHVIFAGNQFIAVGSGFVLVSATGTTWTRYNTPVINSWNGNLKIAYLNTGTPTYIIVSRGARTTSPYLSNIALRSTDLTSWTSVGLPAYTIDVAAGNGVFTILTTTLYTYYTYFLLFVLSYYYYGYIRIYASPTGVAGSWQEQTFPYYYGPNSYGWSRNYWYYYYYYNWPYYYNFSGWYLEYGANDKYVATNNGGEIYSTQ